MNRMFKSYYSNRSVRFKLLFSYILLITIPLAIVGVGGYEWILRTINYHTEKVYASMLEMSIRDNDNMFLQLDTLANQLSNKHWVMKITFMQGDTIDQRRLDSWARVEYIQNMHALNSSMDFVSDIGILFPARNMVIASYGSSDYRFMVNHAFQIEGKEQADWDSLLGSLQMGRSIILPSQVMNRFGAISTGFLYVRPIIHEVHANHRSVLIAFVSERAFLSNLRPLIIDSGASVTVNTAMGEPFLVYGDGMGHSSMQITSESKETGWVYTLTIPKHLMVPGARNVRNIILIVAGILCLLGLVASFGFTRDIYQPIGKLVNMMNNHFGEERRKVGQNEYEWLQDSIHTMIEYEQSLKEELTTRKPILQEVWLHKLVNGEIEPLPEFEKTLHMLGIHMPYATWRVVILLGLLGGQSSEKEGESTGLNLADHLESTEGIVKHGFRTKVYHVFIFNYLEEDLFGHHIVEWISKIPHALLGIGNACQDWYGVADSFKEAVMATDYHMFEHEKRVIYYNEISENRNSFSYSMEAEYKLSNLLKQGDSAGAITLFRDIVKNNINQRNVSLEGIYNLLANIELTAIKSLDDMDIHEIWMNRAKNRYTTNDSSWDNVERISERIESSFLTIAEMISKRSETDPSNITQMIQFVDDSITNSDLSLAVVADRFHVSSSYISRQFRESTGKNYHQYVKEKRLAIARELLSKDMDISAIAYAAGYLSDVTFRRVFKHAMGISPSEYRKRSKGL